MEPRATSRAVIPFSFAKFGSVRPPVAGKRVLFVAGFAHPPNEDAAIWFVEQIFRRSWPPCPTRISTSSARTRPSAFSRSPAAMFPSPQTSATPSCAYFFQVGARRRGGAAAFRRGYEAQGRGSAAERVPLVTTEVGAQGLPGLREGRGGRGHACRHCGRGPPPSSERRALGASGQGANSIRRGPLRRLPADIVAGGLRRRRASPAVD